MPPPSAGLILSFASRLERLAPGIEYFALPVPATVTARLGTRGPVPVTARVNGCKPFLVSLYPKGSGRHGLRVKASVRDEVGLKEGTRVRVTITVRDRTAGTSLPADVSRALRTAGGLKEFTALPAGMRDFALRKIAQAVKPETRAKRIAEAIKLVRSRRK